jgi:hypothetical protein
MFQYGGGRMRLCLLTLVLQLVASSAAGQVNDSPQKGKSHIPASVGRMPSAVVRELYREVVVHHPVGIPDDAEMNVFAPTMKSAFV